jgi:UDP-N-acetylmuramyl pentapeptide phosphotransferase/UDP-N-acetylglucosamine-1-phosphate transferase
MHTVYYIILALSSFLFASIGIWAAYLVLKRYELFDSPNARSNHTSPVPTGAGIAFILVSISFLMVANAPENLLWGALLLTIVSFIDDRLALPINRRLGVQLIAVLLALGTIDGPVLQGLVPLWLDYPIVVLLWLWFINLYNFMDGIDEITVTETSSIGVGIMVLAFTVTDIPRALAIDSVIIVAAVLAFYPWNRHPASLFMGDAGSVPLGFLMGYLLFNLAGAGYWQAALILPAYYLTDATVTLVRRGIARKPIWRAHSEHAYQKAVRGGRTHAQVARTILALNLFLIALACASVISPLAATGILAIAYVLVVITYIILSRPQRIARNALAA